MRDERGLEEDFGVRMWLCCPFVVLDLVQLGCDIFPASRLAVSRLVVQSRDQSLDVYKSLSLSIYIYIYIYSNAVSWMADHA